MVKRSLSPESREHKKKKSNEDDGPSYQSDSPVDREHKKSRRSDRSPGDRPKKKHHKHKRDKRSPSHHSNSDDSEGEGNRREKPSTHMDKYGDHSPPIESGSSPEGHRDRQRDKHSHKQKKLKDRRDESEEVKFDPQRRIKEEPVDHHADRQRQRHDSDREDDSHLDDVRRSGVKLEEDVHSGSDSGGRKEKRDRSRHKDKRKKHRDQGEGSQEAKFEPPRRMKEEADERRDDRQRPRHDRDRRGEERHGNDRGDARRSRWEEDGSPGHRHSRGNNRRGDERRSRWEEDEGPRRRDDNFRDQQRSRQQNDDRRREARQQRDRDPDGGNFGGEQEEETPAVPKEQPNFEVSGKLAEDTNTFRGVVIKYNEPAEARKPKRRWRLYGFKGEESLPMLPIHRQSAYLLGRDRRVADIPVDHPSCSKQHAVLQYRLTDYIRPDGSNGRKVRPYIIDLGSANGTFVNNQRIEASRYVELFERDLIKFGFSTREFVLMHENVDISEVAEQGSDASS